MTKQEFLNLLKDKTAHLPKEELEKAFEYYSECIDDKIEDGMSEEEAVKSMGNIESIVSSIEEDLPFSKIMKTRIKNSKEKLGNNILWIILAICGFPIWAPLLFALISVLFTMYLTVVVVSFSLIIALFACLISGVAGLVMGFIVICKVGIPTGIMIAGLSLVLFGLSIMFIKPFIFISKKILCFIPWFWKKIKGLFIQKKGV